MAAAQTPMLSASRVGNYEIKSFLGKPATGSLYLAGDRFGQREVAIKVRSPRWRVQAAPCKRFNMVSPGDCCGETACARRDSIVRSTTVTALEPRLGGRLVAM